LHAPREPRVDVEGHYMDHEFAETSGIADRYLMDELTAQERIEFEAHYFDCASCADQVRNGAIFIDTAKEVMRTQKVESASERRTGRKPMGWFAWLLTPATLAPTLAAAALAIMVGYQNLVTLPALQRPQLLSTSVLAPLAREEAPVITIDRRLPHFNLNFLVDFPRAYSNYICQFTNEKGDQILTLETGPRDVSSFTLSFLLRPAQFPPGRYELTLRPQPDTTGAIQRYTFMVPTGDQK
jgi:hypothetical protein